MLRRTSLPRLLAVLVAPLAAIGCGDESLPTGGTGGGATTASGGSVDDIMSTLPESCSFDCSKCAEPETPFDCPTIKPWDKVPHAGACPAWDGTYPAKVAGQCTASDPTGEAALPTGPIAGGLILPDGHRIRPAGRELVFDEPDLVGGFPMSIVPLTGTHFALVSDGGIKDNALRLVDLDALAGAGKPVASYVAFPQPSSLFYGIAWLPPDRALASGGGDGVIYAFDVDTAKGTLARAPARDITLGAGDGGRYFSGAVAIALGGSRLVVAPSEHGKDIRVLSLGSADYGAMLKSVPIGSKSIFDLRLDPFDPTMKTLYATDQGKSLLLAIDAEAGAVVASYPVGKNPSQMVFLDGTYLAVAEADSDDLVLFDRAAGAVVARVPVFEKGAPHGFSPTALGYDPATKRIYATLAGVNAVEAYDFVPGAPPSIVPAGRIPTAWWPTGVMVNGDGALVVVTGKGHGTGTDGQQYTWGQGAITERMRGSIQHVPAQILADLTAQSAVVDQNHKLGELPGRSQVICPAGAADFPIPADNQSGPSQQIKRVILVVRENKTYDSVFGDRKDLGDGDPSLIMAGDPVYQAKIWQNARAIAAQFTNFDNFYTDAEQSIQGHTWTVYGRTTDYMERTWIDIWGRATRGVATPTTPVDTPLEGGIFTWLSDNKIGVEDMGEIIGNFALDTSYPGLIYAQSRPDVDKSCYLGGRIRLRCDLNPFTYVVQSNDHTFGGSAGLAAPEVMIAVNDEASGLLLDALSHSPMWQDSLLIITEDDPQDGGDHIDLHRSILLMASPWIRHGYVSHGHYDMASVYKMVAHIYGIPYHNDMIQNAMVPFDAFSATPDYTPFTYLPRKVTAPCNAAATPEAREAQKWDFDDLDDQPGLSQQIMRMMRQPPAQRGVRVLP